MLSVTISTIMLLQHRPNNSSMKNSLALQTKLLLQKQYTGIGVYISVVVQAYNHF